MKLVKYDQATRMLAQLTKIDEVKKIRDKAVAVAAYAKQAKDSALIEQATQVRVKAETRTGELLIDMAIEGKRQQRNRPPKKFKNGIPTLKDIGISLMESSRWQKLAIMWRADPEEWQHRLNKLCRMAIAASEGDKAVITEARAERHKTKIKLRKNREKKLGNKLLKLPDKKYGVIVADPEWKFEAWSEKGLDATSPDNHYSTSELDVIKSRNVESIAADDCVLFLWATNPMLPQALEVMKAWGFNYVSNYCWNKNRAGTGYWSRGKHELMLIGTRGKIPAPAEGSQWESVIDAPVGRHSEKPEKFMEMIEGYFPTLPKIELNCRKPRSGWDAWGNEVKLEAAE